MPYSYQQQAELVQAVTGWNTSTWELAKVGERSINLTRIFNLREGMTAKDDTLPPRLFEVPIGDKGYVVEPEQLQLAIKTYYAMMGWDEEGRPTLAKLQELGIEWAGDFDSSASKVLCSSSYEDEKGEVLLDFSKNTTWSQLFKTLEEEFGFEFSQNVFTLVNGKSIWSYQSNEELIDTAKVIIEVFPAPVGG